MFIEILTQLQDQFLSSMDFLNGLTDFRKNFKDEWYDQIKHNKYRNNPKAYEKNPWPISTDAQTEHITRYEPVINNHNMKKSNQTSAKIIKIHQVV